jgi:hypothetical protein
MTASPVGVDRVAERHAGLRGDGVDHASRLDLEEFEAAELAVAGAPGGRFVFEERLLRAGGLVGEAPAEPLPGFLRGPHHSRSLIERVFVVERFYGWCQRPQRRATRPTETRPTA